MRVCVVDIFIKPFQSVTSAVEFDYWPSYWLTHFKWFENRFRMYTQQHELHNTKRHWPSDWEAYLLYTFFKIWTKRTKRNNERQKWKWNVTVCGEREIMGIMLSMLQNRIDTNKFWDSFKMELSWNVHDSPQIDPDLLLFYPEELTPLMCSSSP